MGALDDLLLAPPRNPTAPPDALADLIRGLGQRGAQWAKTPGTIMQGVQPETPGQWSEEDQFRQNHLQDTPYQWAPEASLLMTMPRTGNAGALTSGAGSKMTQSAADIPALSEQLKQALFSSNREEFPALFESIKSMAAGDLKALAKEFYGGGSYASGADALKKIGHRWDNLEMIRRKSEAVGGRSAG